MIFVFVQAAKTVRRPERMAALPGFIARTLKRRFYLNVPLNPTAVAVAGQPSATSNHAEAYALFLEAHRYLDAGDPVAASETFRRCIEKQDDDTSFYFMAAMCLIFGQGRYKEAVALFARANALRQQRKKALRLSESPLRFLDRTWSGSFGHIAEIDYVLKLGILEGRKPENTILHVPSDVKVPNRFLLEQWRPHVRFIVENDDLPLPLVSLDAVCFDFRGPLLPDGSTTHYWEAAARTYRQWHAENRGPIVTFPADVAERGRKALETVGVPRNAWYVVLHVREAGSKPLHSQIHDVLNARIADYLPAIEEVTRRGGWVIRAGDPTMSPLPALPNVVDYSHSDIRSDWMDIFLFSSCRFFIGTSSGPAYVPPIYDVPCVLTNWWPPAQRPWHPNDIFIPKLYRRLDDNSYLTLSETLAEPFGYCNSLDYLRQHHNVVVEDNSSDDIKAAVAEMLDRLQQTVVYEPEDLRLRDRLETIYAEHSALGMAPISRDFLRKHPFFSR